MFRIFYCLSLLAVWLIHDSTVFAQIAAHPHDDAATQTQPCDPVAEIHDVKLCRADIELPPQTLLDMQTEYEANNVDPQKALEIRKLERAADIIWLTALEHEFGAQALQAGTVDIAAYSKAFKSALDNNYIKDKQRLERVDTLLGDDTITPEQRTALRQLKSSLETSIRFYDQRTEQRNAMPPEFINLLEETEHEMAETILNEWLIARLLYKKYGGEVVMVSGRIEPVGAYLTFLDAIESETSLRIHDQSYQNALNILRGKWINFSENESVSEEEAKDYFAHPANKFQSK